MGIYDRLERPGVRGDVSWSNVDDRWYQSVGDFSSTFSGFPIGPDTAKRVSAVFACNSLIAETLASLPCILRRRLPDGGKEKARDHRLYRTLRFRPNPWMTPIDFFGSGQMHAGLRGNAYSEIREDGRRVELFPLHPDRITVEQLTSGRLRYQYQDPETLKPRTLLQDQVVHVRDLSEDGFTGQARAALSREAIAVAAAGEAFVGGFFKNDATGRLLFKHPASLTAEKRKEFLGMINENWAGYANRSKSVLLTHGVQAEELGKHDDSGFIIDPRKFQVSDVARFWRVPGFMIGLEEKSTSWGTGIAEQVRGLITFTIKPWTDRWAQALTQALLTEEEQEELFVEFLFADLVRGDLKTRMEAYKIGKDIGMWSPNELREKENEGPREGGEEYQETTAGAAPNQNQGSTPPQAIVSDAVWRIASAEIRDVERHAVKAQDTGKWVAWLEESYAGRREYAVKVFAPIGEAYKIDSWRLLLIGERVECTGLMGLVDGVPEGWAERRRMELAAIVDETLNAAKGVEATAA